MKFEYNKNIDLSKDSPTWKVFNEFWKVLVLDEKTQERKTSTEICKADDEWLALIKRFDKFCEENKCKDAFTSIFAIKIANAYLSAMGETLKGIEGKRTELDEIY
jgi:hypothetical protein